VERGRLSSSTGTEFREGRQKHGNKGRALRKMNAAEIARGSKGLYIKNLNLIELQRGRQKYNEDKKLEQRYS